MSGRTENPATPATTSSARLIPPPNGAVVRMYRIGHGDCFLLAFAGEDSNSLAYVLIDCGYKPGSTKMVRKDAADPADETVFLPDAEQPTTKAIAADIFNATGGRVDVAIITHEHQDHLNAITIGNFGKVGEKLRIGQTWLAWTEDPDDPDAKALRRQYEDHLMGLMRARSRLGGYEDERLNALSLAVVANGNTEDQRKRLEDERTESKARLDLIDDLLAYEIGASDEEPFDAAEALRALLASDGQPVLAAAHGAAKPKWTNKHSLKLFRDKAENGVRYLRPHERMLHVPGAPKVRVFPLGPPREEARLRDMDPVGDEEFHFGARFGLADGILDAFAAAANPKRFEGAGSPFAAKYRVPLSQAATDQNTMGTFNLFYGSTASAGAAPATVQQPRNEVASDAEFRRIDADWLHAVDQIALALDDYTNNTSLVLAFELSPGGKVLLFAADAQRGSWLSWNDKPFEDGTAKMTVRDLMARTVLYKVGHHGSHNGTLKNSEDDARPSLNWMATGQYGHEFTAMITAVRAWAETQKGWDHPLKAIKDALLKKAAGRVIQTDTEIDAMTRPEVTSENEWKAFKDRCTGHRLYFDIRIDA